MEGQDDGVTEQSQQHDLRSILSCSDRDFLIRNNDDQAPSPTGGGIGCPDLSRRA